MNSAKKLPENIILMDSGANITVLNTETYSTHTVKNTKRSIITVADGTRVEITKTGTFMDENADICTKFKTSLLSISQHTKNDKQIAIFNHNQMYMIKNDDNIKKLLNEIINVAEKENLITIIADNKNGLYQANIDDLNKNLHNTIKESQKKVKDNKILDEATIYANTTYYTDIPNVHADNARDLVRYLHEAWNHPDKITMCNII